MAEMVLKRVFESGYTWIPLTAGGGRVTIDDCSDVVASFSPD